MRGFAQQNPYRLGYDVSAIDFADSSSHEDFDDEEGGTRGKRHLRDDLKDLKVEFWNLMSILTRRTILIRFKPLKGSSNSKTIMTKSHSSRPFLN